MLENSNWTTASNSRTVVTQGAGSRRPRGQQGEGSHVGVLFVPRPLCSFSQAQLIRCTPGHILFPGNNCTSVTLTDSCWLYGFQTSPGSTITQSIPISVHLRVPHFKWWQPARKQPLSLSSEKCQEETLLGRLTTDFQQSLKAVQPATLKTSENS